VADRIKVVVDLSRQDVVSRFGAYDRTDTLALNTESNAEQVAQLRQEIIELNRVVNGLARRVCPELQPRRLLAEEVIIYSPNRYHVHVPNFVASLPGDLGADNRAAVGACRIQRFAELREQAKQ
jgi:hypothetical protein